MLSNCGVGEESLGQQGDKPVNSKRSQPWIFIEKTDAEAEAPVLWPPDLKSHLLGEDPNAGKGWGGGEEGEMVGWHHGLNGHEFEHTPLGDSGGQRSLVVHGVVKSQTDLATKQQHLNFTTF